MLLTFSCLMILNDQTVLLIIKLLVMNDEAAITFFAI